VFEKYPSKEGFFSGKESPPCEKGGGNI